MIPERAKKANKKKYQTQLQNSIQNAIEIQKKLANHGVTVKVPNSEILPPPPPPTSRKGSSDESFSDYTSQVQGSAAAQIARGVLPMQPRQGYVETSDEVVFNFNLNEDQKSFNIPIEYRNNQKILNLLEQIHPLKDKAKELKERIMRIVQEYNNTYPRKKPVEILNSEPGTDVGSLTVRLSPRDGNTNEGKVLIDQLQQLGQELYLIIQQIVDLRKQIASIIGLFYTGGSYRTSHLSKHKNKNKTKHKHNYNHKARTGRKNKKTIKKYRGMSRMHVMPRMQKQNVAVYRKYKKTTRKFKPTRHAKMNKNKPKNSNKKSRKIRR